MGNGYNIAIIRKLLNAAFSDEDFTFFCYDHYREIYAKFSGDMSHTKKIHLLIEYCQTHQCLDELLDFVSEENVSVFEQFSAHLKTSPTSAESGGHQLGSPKITLSRLPNTGEHLIGREKELTLLDAAWKNPQTHIFSLVAWGGVGKSTLSDHWLQRLVSDDYRGARRIYVWSFYIHGTSFDSAIFANQFIDDALRWFGDPDPTEGTPRDKGRRLANLIRQQRTLLILDGLEPLQYPPGPEEGKLTNPAVQTLLLELGIQNNGLCLISTRLKVTDLDRFQGRSAERLDLEHLSPEAGAEYLGIQGVKGTMQERLEASKAFGGHALALTLLGSYLHDAFGGDIRHWREIGPLLVEMRHGGHARRVMQAYQQWLAQDESELGPVALAILRLLGLYDRPADPASLAALRSAPPIPGLTEALFQSVDRHRFSWIKKLFKLRPSAPSVDPISEQMWRQAVARLRRAKLLAEGDNLNTLDAHPLVREHFAAQLETTVPDAWREGHNRLYQHLKTTTKTYPDTLAEMAPLFAAITHGCRAGEHQQVLDEIYWGQIKRTDEHISISERGAFRADLATLYNFFSEPWHRPIESIKEEDQALVLSRVGFCLRALGRLIDAQQPFGASLKAGIEQKQWEGAAIRANNLSEISLTLGKIDQALDYAKQAVDFANRSNDIYGRIPKWTTLADVHHQAGRIADAEQAFAEAEVMQKEQQPGFPILYSVWGFRYCDFLLSQGQILTVQERAYQTLEWAKIDKLYLDIALDSLSLGRAYLNQAVSSPNSDNHASYLLEAERYLNQAVVGLQQAGRQDYLPYGLLARAEFYVFQEDWARARRDLDEAMEMAIRSGMRLHECDAHLGYARLALAQGSRGAEESFDEAQGGPSTALRTGKGDEGDWLKEARGHVVAAKRLVEETGYHRRDGEVAELEVKG